jgi:hypothetical protein
MAKLKQHWYVGTWHYEKPATSFYYDFTNSSVAAIWQDWQITNPGNIVYDTNKWLWRTSSSEYSLNMSNCINMSNVTKKVTFKIWVVTRASSWWVYWGTINVNNWTSSLWIHDNSQNYMTWDINWRYESGYWYRSTWYNVSWYDIVEWDFENLTMKCTVLWDWQRTVNIQPWQLDTIKTFTNVYLWGSTMWWKDILIEWE